MRVKLACGSELVLFSAGPAGCEIVGPVVPAGYTAGATGLSPADIARRIRSPVAGPGLVELVRELQAHKAGSRTARKAGGRTTRKAGSRPGPVVIVVDDLTRPTPAGLLAAPVLEELEAAGVTAAEIVFLGATGSHRPMTNEEFEVKLGIRIAWSYRCVSHDFTGPLVHLGRTARGTPVDVNPLVAEASVLIGLGAVYPHSEVGFSGGGKIVVPGTAGLATMTHNHVTLGGAAPTHEDAYHGNQRRDLDEAAAMTGLGFVVNVVLSSEAEVVQVFAGSPVPAHAAATRYAATHFAPSGPGVSHEFLAAGFDGVMAGCGPFDTDIYQAERGLGVAGRLCRAGGAILWAAGCAEGRGFHGVLERTAWRETRWEGLKRLAGRFSVVLCAPGLEAKDAVELLPPEISVCREPEEASRLFAAALQGAGGDGERRGGRARVSVAHLPWASVLNY
jgi:hypothetical protein